MVSTSFLQYQYSCLQDIFTKVLFGPDNLKTVFRCLEDVPTGNENEAENEKWGT